MKTVFSRGVAAIALVLLSLSLMGFGFYGAPNPPAFTPTGYATVTATTSGASAVLGSTAASVPSVTTAMVTNLGPNPIYVKFGASNVVATTTNAFPVPVSAVVSIAIGGAGYVSAASTTGTSTVVVVTGY